MKMILQTKIDNTPQYISGQIKNLIFNLEKFIQSAASLEKQVGSVELCLLPRPSLCGYLFTSTSMRLWPKKYIGLKDVQNERSSKTHHLKMKWTLTMNFIAQKRNWEIIIALIILIKRESNSNKSCPKYNKTSVQQTLERQEFQILLSSNQYMNFIIGFALRQIGRISQYITPVVSVFDVLSGVILARI